VFGHPDWRFPCCSLSVRQTRRPVSPPTRRGLQPRQQTDRQTDVLAEAHPQLHSSLKALLTSFSSAFRPQECNRARNDVLPFAQDYLFSWHLGCFPHITTLMMETEIISETLKYNAIVTWLIFETSWHGDRGSSRPHARVRAVCASAWPPPGTAFRAVGVSLRTFSSCFSLVTKRISKVTEIFCVWFQVLTVMARMLIFWVITPCGLVARYCVEGGSMYLRNTISSYTSARRHNPEDQHRQKCCYCQPVLTVVLVHHVMAGLPLCGGPGIPSWYQ
jgi:hypothetical protein